MSTFSFLNLNIFILGSLLLLTTNAVVVEVAIAMFGYMTEIDTVDMTETQEIIADGKYQFTYVDCS